MDAGAFLPLLSNAWDGILALLSRGGELWQSSLLLAQPYLDRFVAFIANPWARAVGLAVIVYFTIRVIASVYSGDKQNSEIGPIGIRPHTAQRISRETIVLPRSLMPMNMDGVRATLRIYYAYVDARGKRRHQLIHTHPEARLNISPTKLTKVTTTIYGQEIPDVATADVCFPPIEMDEAPSAMPATPERARDYARLHCIIENWREDDDAPLISMHADEHESIRDAREQFILAKARKVAAAREGNLIQRVFNRGLAAQRPNVVGSYFVKLEFSHNPWFVLTRHPDRELKMTAWLTVLTSAFALIMDAWPKLPTADANAGQAQSERASGRLPRIPIP